VPSLSFQAQFVPAVENGLAELAGKPLPHDGVRPKRQTIRAVRKRPFKVGDTLHFFWGMRTEYCRRLGRAVCTSLDEIAIEWSTNLVRDGVVTITLGGERVSRGTASALAMRDGFGPGGSPLGEMAAWFERTHGLPFRGVVVRW
jgi:hypothetical protein